MAICGVWPERLSDCGAHPLLRVHSSYVGTACLRRQELVQIELSPPPPERKLATGLSLPDPRKMRTENSNPTVLRKVGLPGRRKGILFSCLLAWFITCKHSGRPADLCVHWGVRPSVLHREAVFWARS